MLKVKESVRNSVYRRTMDNIAHHFLFDTNDQLNKEKASQRDHDDEKKGQRKYKPGLSLKNRRRRRRW